MELNPFHGIAAVSQAHDFPLLRPGGKLKVRWQTIRLHHQGVITGSRKGAGQATENRMAIMKNLGRLPVHQPWRPNHTPSKGLPDGLMAKANPQNWYFPGKMINHLQGYPGFIGSARPW